MLVPRKCSRLVTVGFQRESIHFSSDDLEELSGGDGPGLDFKEGPVTEVKRDIAVGRAGEAEALDGPWLLSHHGHFSAG